MKLRRPSPALLIACLALFVSLGGVSYGVATDFIDSRELRDNTIRTQDLRNNDIRGKDIRNSTIRTRDVGANALTGKDIAESKLLNLNAKTLDGIGLAGLVRPDVTPFASLVLGTGWTPISGEQVPQVDIDPFGYVHLRGSAQGLLPEVAVLPAGARPVANSYFLATQVTADTEVKVTVEPDGEIKVSGGATEVALDGINFKAGG